MRDVAVGPDIPEAVGRAMIAALEGRESEEAVEVLGHVTGAEITGIVTYGSFLTKGRAVAGDLDALIVSSDAVAGGLWGRSGDVELDLFVVGEAALFAASLSEWAHLRAGRVLYDKTRESSLQDWLTKLEGAAPKPVAASDLLRDEVWARRMLDRIRDNLAERPEVAWMRAASLFSQIPDLYARRRARHGASVSAWVEDVRVSDPEMFGCLQAVLQNEGPAHEGRLEALNALVQAVFTDRNLRGTETSSRSE